MTSMTLTPNTVLLIANEPTTQDIRMIGISTRRGTLRICRDSRMARKPSGSSARFAMKNAMNTAWISSGCCMNTVGPGFMPFMYSTPMTIAVIESPGMPNTSAGTQAPASPALFAVPASTSPSTCPVPNVAGVLEKRLETANAIHAAMSEPAPGRMPITAPMNPPRNTFRR